MQASARRPEEGRLKATTPTADGQPMEETERRPEKRSYVPDPVGPGTCTNPHTEAAKRVRIGCLDMPGANDDQEGESNNLNVMEEPLLGYASPKESTKLSPFKRFLDWLGRNKK